MYKEAAPFIQPDMTNYYRLLREARLREQLGRTYPDLPARYEALYQNAAVASFLQAIPTQNINPRDEFNDSVQPGVVPRGIEITNAIIERKIMLRRLTEACLNPARDQAAIALIEQDIHNFVEYLGLAPELGQQAITETRAMAARLQTRSTLRVIPGAEP